MRCPSAYAAATAVLLAMSSAGQAMPLTLWFDRAPLPSVLQAVAEFAGLNLILSEEVRGEATLHIAHTPWPRVLEALAEIHDLSVVRRDGILLIQSRARRAAGGSPPRHLRRSNRRRCGASAWCCAMPTPLR
ncbi:hypothetical protein DCF40_16725 [Edwardsiella piscicida]|uniref:hypothetical protein n=1 Tax=Edwardsiella piscicida TaxID=1263550 RepID=UPI001CF35F46|nr:hypothetical protein [Edwardsiella piscicida]UCQ57381.1 hypothetical protein DCF40_16725 [Edwardsiella piscicida]